MRAAVAVVQEVQHRIGRGQAHEEHEESRINHL
jgi:hypothetical protein